jgi:DNA-binding GntR family transcriptional regulator
MPTTKHPSDSSGPRYLWLHDCLLKDIQAGTYPVGSTFPTEEQIAAQYQVSRHTVREATRRLVDSGLIRRRPSTGTTVTANESNHDKPYVAALGSLKELMDYTRSTRVAVFGQESVVLKKAQAKALNVEIGSTWLLLHGYRHLVEKKEPISYTQVYLRPEYAEIAKRLKGNHASIFNLHADLFNEPVDAVIQRIEAAKMPVAAAQRLGVSTTIPTLKMTRIYLNEAQHVMSASRNFYIPERFELVTQWQRSHVDEL